MRRQPYLRTSSRREPSACQLHVLFERCSAGDPRAREEIIVAFLPYADHLARGYRGRGEPVEDLVQTACLGLIKAVDRYDPERSGSFLAFADPTIRGEIRRYFRDRTWPAHVPRSIHDRAIRVAGAREQLRTSSGREPTTRDLADHLGLGPSDVADAEAAMGSRWIESLDAPRPREDGERLALNEIVGEPDPGFERVETGLEWMHGLRRLPSRDRRVLAMRFGGGFTQTEIARGIGVSQVHVSRILRTATATVAAALSPG